MLIGGYVMKTMLVIFLVALMALAVPAVAQEDFTNLRPCTDRQMVAIITRSDQEFAEDYAVINDMIQGLGDTSTMLDIVLAADDLQVRWWYEIAPEFPRCAEAVAMEIAVGRILDELLIASLQGHVAFVNNQYDEDMFNRGGYHLQAWGALQDELATLLDEMGE